MNKAWQAGGRHRAPPPACNLAKRITAVAPKGATAFLLVGSPFLFAIAASPDDPLERVSKFVRWLSEAVDLGRDAGFRRARRPIVPEKDERTTPFAAQGRATYRGCRYQCLVPFDQATPPTAWHTTPDFQEILGNLSLAWHKTLATPSTSVMVRVMRFG